MTKHDEPRKSTLLYIESCVVDKNARLEAERMNDGDFENIEQFEEEGIIEVKRIPAKEKLKLRSGGWKPTHNVTKFTEEAWEEAHEHRKERGTVQ